MGLIRAVIFDMDGVLVNSEPLWRRAEVEVFGAIGAPITEAMCLETTGLRIDQVVEHWQRRFGFTATNVRQDILARVEALIRAEGQPLPGAREAVQNAARKYPIALASSSPYSIIDAVLACFGLRDLFSVIHSADEEPYGKPHPIVFLTTAEKLGVDPVDCLVIEDSLNGVLAAKAARMTCVAVPEEAHRSDPRFAIADRILRSLEELVLE